jgi:RHS repeat-associated protein
MRLSKVLPLVAAPALYAAYQYYYTDPLTSVDPAKWRINGSVTPTAGGLTGPSGQGGSLISLLAVPDGSSAYEIKTTLTLTASGGYYAHYLHASTDALHGPAAQGVYYAVELLSPAFSGSSCVAGLAVIKRVNGEVTWLAYTTVACRDQMVLRSVWLPAPWQHISVYVDDRQALLVSDSSIPSGQPGVGARETPAGNAISSVALGPADRVAPASPQAQSFASAAFPNRVDLAWQGVTDDTNGIGLFCYSIVRNGVWLMATQTPELSDPTVQPGATYTYHVYAVDYHYNHSAPAVITVQTPPPEGVDPRRVGVRPTGAYWGAAGERIDLLSGNLNFTLPLLRAQGRGGSGVTFALSYNSQSWRRDPGGTWKLGRDVGYGFGWRLQAGSLTPYWSDYWTIHHYVFTDSSGAEYRLDVNNNGVWTSREGIYLEYDSASERLYFPDGTFWVMGAISAGTEEDAGTRYPTIIQDTNGNQIYIRYHPGRGVPWPNSSARINEIEDVRARQIYWPVRYVTYAFTYNNDPIPHLTAIRNYIGTGEAYDFTYATAELYSPFSPPASYGPTAFLQRVSIWGLNLSHQFEYGTGAGELTRILLPYGASLRYQYRDFTFAGGRTLREVQWRHLRASASAPEYSWTIARDEGGDPRRSLHWWAQLFDPTGISKVWWFWAEGPAWQRGLLAAVEDRTAQNTTGKRVESLSWTQDAAGNPYISAVLTTLDPNTPYQKQMRVEQTLDVRGNVTQLRVFDWGNLSQPARTFTYTYLTGSQYTSRRIYNRLVSATVSDGSQNVGLVWNSYDVYSLTNRTDLRNHDTANYGANFLYRGNLTAQTGGPRPQYFWYDITGNPTLVSAWPDGRDGVAITTTSQTNYAAPSVLRSDALNTNLNWTAFLGLASETGPNADTVSFTYDDFARPSSTTSPDGAVTTYSYGISPPTRTATTNGRWEKTTFDGLGRPILTELGAGSTVYSIVEREYVACACSPVGRLGRISQPYAPGGTVYWTTYSYDSLGRVIQIRHPDNSGVTSYVYEGNTVKVIDPAGKWKKYTLDAFGNLIQVTEPNPAGGADHQTYYRYNLRDQLVRVEMPREGATQVRTFSYDALGRLVSETHPETGTTTYGYHEDGLRAFRQNARGQRIEYDYDEYRRLIRIRRPGETVTLTWGWSVAEGTAGRLAGWSNGFLEESFRYTASGRVSWKRLRALVGGNWEQREVVYSYDNEGRLRGASYPGVGPLTYSYDALGRLSGLTEQRDRTVTWVRDTVYNPAGQPVSLVRLYQRGESPGEDEQVSERWSYNARGQLVWHGVQRFSGEYLLNVQYRYPATTNNGRLSQMVVGGEEVNFTYDSLNRLVRAETSGPQWGQAYSYDGFGNLVAQTVTKGTAPSWTRWADPATNRLTGFSYDATGNVTGMPNPSSYTQFEYDAENRLVRAIRGENPDYLEQYRYGLDNRRLWRLVQQGEGNRSEQVFFYGAYGELLDGGRIYFGGRLIGRSGISEGVGVVTDRLGSVGGPARYYPYGQERQATPEGTEKFATYYRDATGLDYAWNRYYSPTWGRFMQADPSLTPEALKNPQGWNRYAYVAGDPVNYYDPAGLDACSGNYGVPCFSITVVRFLYFLWLRSFGGGGGGSWDLLVAEAAEPIELPEPGLDLEFEPPESGNRPECDRRDPLNVKKLNWIAAHRKDAAAVAGGLEVTTEAILGLSALESGWGTGRFAQEANNFFGLHWPASFAIGYLVARDNPAVKVAIFTNYRTSGESFAKDYGKYVRGLTDPADFAKALQDSGKFGVGTEGYAARLANVIRELAKRMDCE